MIYVPIDISNLSPEKRAFLKVHPEFLKGLEQDLRQQPKRIEAKRSKLRKSRSHWQRRIGDVEEKVEALKQKYNPMLMEITRKLERNVVSTSEFVCPVCGGGGDDHNKMNEKPWCYKCKVHLVPRKKLAKWKEMADVKVVLGGLKKDLERLNPGLNPDNKENK